MLEVQKPTPKAQIRERRRARRHTVNFKAKAGLRWDNPTPCTVRNVSTLGALLEFDNPVIIPKRFRIAIDNPQFAADCEVRHATSTTAGVMFISNHAEALALFS